MFKKEFIGNLYREGTLYTQEAIEVYDHDFPTLADGVAIPMDCMILSRTLAISSWELVMKLASLRVTVSFTGGNSTENTRIRSQHRSCCYVIVVAAIMHAIIFLRTCCNAPHRRLESQYGLPAIPRIHRNTTRLNIAYSHLSRMCRGVIFKNVEIVRELMAKTTTRTGLHVYVTVLDTIYKIGKKMADTFKTTMRIVFDDYLPQWNYTAMPD
jgi:hypothetical protein